MVGAYFELFGTRLGTPMLARLAFSQFPNNNTLTGWILSDLFSLSTAFSMGPKKKQDQVSDTVSDSLFVLLTNIFFCMVC